MPARRAGRPDRAPARRGRGDRWMWLATPAWADPFVFSTGTPDGLLGALSQPAGSGTSRPRPPTTSSLSETTSIAQATITGLIPAGTPAGEHQQRRGRGLSRLSQGLGRSPLGAGARAGQLARRRRDRQRHARCERGNARVRGRSLVDASSSVLNTVVDGINPVPAERDPWRRSRRAARWSRSRSPSPRRSFCRRITISSAPRSQVTGGDFLFLSAPKPIVAPGTPFMGDLQAWIRNSDLDCRTGCESAPTSSAAPRCRRSTWRSR